MYDMWWNWEWESGGKGAWLGRYQDNEGNKDRVRIIAGFNDDQFVVNRR